MACHVTKGSSSSFNNDLQENDYFHQSHLTHTLQTYLNLNNHNHDYCMNNTIEDCHLNTPIFFKKYNLASSVTDNEVVWGYHRQKRVFLPG